MLLTAYDLLFLQDSFGIDGTLFSSIRPSAIEPCKAESSGKALDNTIRDINIGLHQAEQTVKRLQDAMQDITRGTPEAEQQKTQRTDGMIDFVLTPWNNVTLAELDTATERLRARLDEFTAGAAEYTFSVEKNNKIHIQLPADIFHGASPAAVMHSIASPTVLYLLNKRTTVYGVIPVLPRDLASVRLVRGSIEGVDPSAFGYEEGKAYPYIEIVLSEEFVRRNEKISGWEPSFALDITVNRCHHELTTYPDADGKTYRVLVDIENIISENFVKTMVGCLTHPLPGSFSVSYSTAVDWEDPAALRAGKRQVLPEEVVEPSMTIKYSSTTADTNSEDWRTTMAGLKKRLDVIAPYAVGTQEVDGNACVLVKIAGFTRLAPYMLHLGHILVAQNFDASDFLVHGADSYGRAVGEDLPFTSYVSVNGSGAASLCVKSESKSAGLLPLTEYAEKVCSAEEPRLCLFFGGLPLLTAGKDDISSGNVLFRRIYGKEQEEIGEQDYWLVQLADILMKTSLPLNLRPKGAYAPNVKEAAALSRANPWYADEKRMTNSIHSIAPDASISFPSTAGSVRVILDLNIDEDLPSTALRLIETIYTVSGFPQSRFQEILFALFPERDKDFERARVWFRKSADGIRLFYAFGNGRVRKYKPEFEALLKANNFFSGARSVFYG